LPISLFRLPVYHSFWVTPGREEGIEIGREEVMNLIKSGYTLEQIEEYLSKK
jgi:hypothetical protein